MATYAAYRHVELDNVGYGKKRVLKPPGGGSSDIFAPPTNEDASPRRGRHRGQSQLGTTLFGAGETSPPSGTISGSTSNSNSNGPKSGNDSHNRLFGPPDAPAHTHSPLNRNHSSRSNICLGSDSNGGVVNGEDNIIGVVSDATGGSSCMPRNPVTGDGVDLTPIRRSTRKCGDGNPVTGTGYGQSVTDSPASTGSSASAMTAANAGNHHYSTTAPPAPSSLQNGKSSNSTSSVDSSPGSASGRAQARTRVPPGGYSSGLW